MDTINSTQETGVFATNTAQLNAGNPTPRMLLGQLWHEGELAVMFGDNSIGKSLLAVQAAQAISNGQAIKGFATETAPQKVLYFDFDNTDRQFSGIYKQCSFSDNFTRVTISRQFTGYHKFGKRMFECMAEMIEETGARVLIIDSLYTLKYFISSNFFIEKLLQLKNQFSLSVLLVAETKKPKFGKPLFLGNLAYNKTLTGVANSVFAMGASVTDKEGRYIIQLKGNKSGSAYDEPLVITGRNTVTGTSPGFEFTGYGTEKQLLLFPPTGLDALILNMKKTAPYLSLGEIAQRLKTNKMKVKRVLERYESIPPVTPGTIETLPTDTFRGEVEQSNHPSHPGVKQPGTPEKPAVTLVTPDEKPETQPAKKLSYSQQLKQRLNKAAVERRKKV